MTVLDASALLVLLFGEPGHEAVAPHLRGGLLSAVNLSEVLARFARDGHDPAAVSARLAGTGIEIVPFDQRQAILAAALAPATRPLGLSLGDRACLALATDRRLPALTADRAWSELPLGIEVRQVR
ncbi:MAG TPA: type II toxin-antitoxin system VapC family toxin [Thermoanaerobaculia bacterium]|nr:type II toxin-antitoxin system VapC family toxin [Thermoanaerobaculia bacterium]